MIRINLLGQVRPKTVGRAVPLESTISALMLAAALGLAIVILAVYYFSWGRELDATNQTIRALEAEKTRLESVRTQVEQFRKEKSVLQQRINVIEELQRNRMGGEELLQTVANTVVRTDSLWLTKLDRKGSSLAIEGTSGSIDAVANFITQLKRSGYFTKVEIKEVKESDIVPAAQTFNFTMTADFSPPGAPGTIPSPATPATMAAPRKG
jgi:Tfp pilus assembly protein PilN